MYMRRTQLYLDQSEREILDQLSAKTGKSVGQLIREAIDQIYCGAQTAENPLSADDPIWEFIGKGKSKETDASARHDDYLYGSSDEDIR
jgi:hypothetical protein